MYNNNNNNNNKVMVILNINIKNPILFPLQPVTDMHLRKTSIHQRLYTSLQ